MFSLLVNGRYSSQNFLMSSMLAVHHRPQMMMMCAARSFAYSPRYVGPNDMKRQKQAEKRKYGMRHHFYDSEQHSNMEEPDKQ